MKEYEVNDFYKYCLTGFHPLIPKPPRPPIRGQVADSIMRKHRSDNKRTKAAFKTKRITMFGFKGAKPVVHEPLVHRFVYGKDVNIRKYIK